MTLHFAVLCLLGHSTLYAQELKLWPDGALGARATVSAATQAFIKSKAGKQTITNIAEPTLTLYRPAKANGTAVIVAPGGGYAFLSAVSEGSQVCTWLQSCGITAALLKYRTPTRDEPLPHAYPVADASRALELLRGRAAELGIKPDRVGLLGFSAGGNLLAHLACDRSQPEHRPDFGIMIYGGGWVEPNNPAQLKSDFGVPADAPPMFILCSSEDSANGTAGAALYLAYRRAERSAELHLYAKGGHGFGMRPQALPIGRWTERCEEWMVSLGYMGSGQLQKETQP